jgi:hypothetical protein
MATTTSEPGAPASRAGVGRRRTRAYGLQVACDLPLAGLPEAAQAAAARETVVRAVAETPSAGPLARLLERRGPGGAPDVTLDRRDSDGALLLWKAGAGSYLVAGDGASIDCAGAHVGGTDWQRFLLAQALPAAALLRGFEPLHAAAVTCDGRALAFTGPSGAGKTSLALALTLGGCGLLADDVLSLELVGDDVMAHPGPGLAEIRWATLDALSLHARGRLGRPLAVDERGLRCQVGADERARPLGALYRLELAPAERVPEIERISSPSPAMLLGSSFNFVVRTPARLKAQLYVHARIAGTVPVFRIAAPAGCRPELLAEHVREHAARHRG